MTLAPRMKSRPPSMTPGTASSLYSMPGMILPTLPALLNIGVFSAITGAASVTP
ncbi:hypothetical protein D9M70_606820 [compost metagenome]